MPLALRLVDLSAGTPRLTPDWGTCMAHCAAVCLDQLHSKKATTTLPFELKKKASSKRGKPPLTTGTVETIPLTDQIKATWADPQEATEYGATGIAVLLVRQTTNYEVVRRARKGTGFDYWLGDANTAHPFKDAAKLEITGTLVAKSDKEMKRLLDTKVDQTKRGGVGLPAVVAVIDFAKPQGRMVVP